MSALPAAARVAVAAREPVGFGHDAVAEVDAANLVVRLVDDHDLLGPLMDLHRIAARTEHRSGHAGAQAVAAGRVAGRLDQRLVLRDLLLRDVGQRQRRPAAASAAARAWPGSV